jgi:Holliday junction resolvase RusA-like endonuclease
MATLTFRVNHTPVPQPRQRHRIVKSQGYVQNYTPSKHPVQAFKRAVQEAALKAAGGAIFEGPIGLSLVFVLPRPQNMTWKTRPMPRYPHVSRGDWDNFGKGICDSLNGLLYKDDRQICMVQLEKWVAAGGEEPHVVVTVQEISL